MHILAFSDLHLARNRAETLTEASTEADLVIGAVLIARRQIRNRGGK